MTSQPAHQNLAAGRWQTLSIAEQLGNIGSEVSRATRAKAQGNSERLQSALSRALELFELTLADLRMTPARTDEISKARDVVADYLVGENAYQSTATSLERYFTPFALLARRDT